MSRRRGYADRIIDWSKEYLTFEALEAGDFSFTNDLEYSLNKGAWTSLTGGTALSVNQGDKVRWRATITPTSSAGIGTFSATCEFNAIGNPLSVRTGDSFVNSTEMPNVYYNFLKLFYQNTKLVNAENLILTSKTLRFYCYQNMFNGCTALITPPVILATTGGQYSCYGMFTGCSSMTTVPSFTISCSSYTFQSMFKNCTSIVTADNITLTGSLNYNTCKEMFYGCTSLTTPINTLPNAMSSGSACYSMFQNCSALTSAPSLPATTLKSACYCNMFNGCTSLTIAPVLPTATLISDCYNGMFKNCSNLKYVKCLATDISASNSHLNWMSGVGSGGTFVQANGMTSWPRSANGVPSNWTLIDESNENQS